MKKFFLGLLIVSNVLYSLSLMATWEPGDYMHYVRECDKTEEDQKNKACVETQVEQKLKFAQDLYKKCFEKSYQKGIHEAEQRSNFCNMFVNRMLKEFSHNKNK